MHRNCQNMAKNSASTGREIWLDGVRGVAAVIVVWFHATAGRLVTPYRSFWDSPASENRYLYQLAPFRIFFSGPGMVDIFFVVSGYSVSIGLIKLRHEGSLARFYQRLTSSVVRRMFRLCFPVAIMMLATHVVYYAGLYTMSNPKGTGCPGAEPRKSPIPHIKCLIRSFISIINVQSGQNLTLNDHFWTIPAEIRGSMKVYLTLLGLSNTRDMARMIILGLLCVRSWWNGTPVYMAFFAGVLFAELDASESLKQQETQAHLSYSYRDHRDLSSYTTRLGRLSTLLKPLVFITGIYLLCLPTPTMSKGTTEAKFPADWFFLDLFPPLPWWGTETTWSTWHTFGAILVIGSMRKLPRFRAPFESRAAQFLGRISFSLYLCHQTVLRVLLNPVMHWTTQFAAGVVSHDDVDSREKWGVVFLSWILAIPLIGGILLLISVRMADAVDQKSIALGFNIERKLRR
ncbi:hypothetical protein HBH56_109160 [Parastagonospora nodorum]|uniref:Acyltransferase 3 domain-containing protein n=1 Tax=Phaeosphaeria nodorum (strain SN15 / ATCC MYA-4574 / FGSC 10173) TaxID=321614 RepID=A0A7U2FDU2_PHANO|nr:hypothetical protein HBH56_109160 [Parastagonospora nodorum]QRD03253.1 hypothetical protein JI435_100230 [Parastagonospora nodorum SN15]KAH3922368.1 hypothetical protein HBH54_226260 [Parastagonospora nodorum]KAH3951299.1 hypothetical protein HBH53_064900 [Parastagonospora nodorum]KAH4065969.1 hypothetical protein HBH50_152970 [Parastagonospora nodorum]